MQSVLVRPQTAIIRPQEYLNAANASEFQNQLTCAMASEQNAALLIDMSTVESLDSAGLMALVATLRLAQKLNKRFALCAVSAPIRIVFELTQLDRVFEIFDSAAAFELTIA
ncbi:MAG: STAS domain-containing protein [Leptolyngbyaceae cyanobacterium CSU_1_3]|nr:STAS domain-containing protein [Leptolyngbyaceae cyanobacterium CSU_1_3]